MKKIKKIAIATPTFNEARNIERLIRKIAEVCQVIPDVNFDLLVIDDNSPDNTALIAEKMGKKLKDSNLNVKVFRRKEKNGIGAAYVAGFKELLKDDLDFIIQMDADLSHNPKYLKNFVEEANSGHDFIVASRYLSNGGTPDWSLFRQVLSRGGNLYSRLFLGSKITDYTGGYNMFSTNLMKRLDIDTINTGGYGFLIELKYRALKNAKSTKQVPIIFRDRQHGNSKMPKNTLIQNFILVPKIRFKKRGA